MSFTYGKKRQNPAIQRIKSDGFPQGLNTLAHPSALKNTELSELVNGTYSQYGSISKRQGCRILGGPMASTTGIINAGMFYNIGGNDYMVRINDLGKVEKYNFTTGVWSLLTGTPPVGYVGTDPEFVDDSPIFDTGAFINMVQYSLNGGNVIIFSDPEDRITYFDGTAWYVFSDIDDPTIRPTIAKTGSGTGTHTYYYRYAWTNEFGTTIGSPANDGGQSDTDGFKDSMPEIDGETYLTVTIPSAPTGATRVAIYRGEKAGFERYLASIDSTETVYIDKGTDIIDNAFAVPEENNTIGFHFYLMDTYKGSIVGTTVEEGKDILVWSAGVGSFTLTNPILTDAAFSFAVIDGAGFDDYGKGDGQDINALRSFSFANNDGLFVFKSSRVGILEFSADGGGSIQNINVIRGTMSPLSPHVAGNNVRFYSQEGVASLGHEQNYGTILRYSVMSLKADAITRRATQANLPKVCSGYHNNLSLFGLSTGSIGSGNNIVLVYDERYDTWAQWTGLYPAVFFKGIHPTTKVEDLYFGDSKTGNVVKMFNGKTDYASSTGSGNAITLSITTKQYDNGLPDKFKKFDKVVMVFGALVGNGTVALASGMGEQGNESYPPYKITSDPVYSGFGGDEWGNQEIGMMQEDEEGETLNIKYINLQQKDLFYGKLNLQNNGMNDELTLIGVYWYLTNSERELPSASRLTEIAS